MRHRTAIRRWSQGAGHRRKAYLTEEWGYYGKSEVKRQRSKGKTAGVRHSGPAARAKRFCPTWGFKGKSEGTGPEFGVCRSLRPSGEKVRMRGCRLGAWGLGLGSYPTCVRPCCFVLETCFVLTTSAFVLAVLGLLGAEAGQRLRKAPEIPEPSQVWRLRSLTTATSGQPAANWRISTSVPT
jgi:hypothetical protein